MADRLRSIQGFDMDRGLPHGLELRHLRYFIAVAEAGTFTHAAQRILIAQPTLSQQVRRLEEMVGTPLLNRRRDGVQLTSAGTVLLREARTAVAVLEHGVSRTRQAGGLGRLSLRVVLPPSLPDALAVPAASQLRAVAAAVGVDIVWLEAALDADFSLIDQRTADAGLGWLPSQCEAAPKPLDTMSLGEFEPEVWISSAHPSAGRGTISLPVWT
jgi:DNA-binding transcriptional LysR family regulator